MANDEYLSNILKWRKEVDHNLRRENSWLALAGLFWLRKGTNLIGSDPDCDIKLPSRAPKQLGRFEFDGSNVTLYVDSGRTLEVNGVQVNTALLEADEEDVPSFITMEEMRMVVVRRSKGVGIRLWDNTRPERSTRPPRTWYPIKEEYRIPATYTRYETPKIVQMPDILGEVIDEKMNGEIAFEFAGQKLKLLATEEPDHRLLIQFKDLTNGKTTFQATRYLYAEPHQEGKVFVDFNKAYNPPCSFTDYATCSFAPRENYLDVAIEAGETGSGHK
jgi:uncharacterized protein